MGTACGYAGCQCHLKLHKYLTESHKKWNLFEHTHSKGQQFQIEPCTPFQKPLVESEDTLAAMTISEQGKVIGLHYSTKSWHAYFATRMSFLMTTTFLAHATHVR